MQNCGMFAFVVSRRCFANIHRCFALVFRDECRHVADSVLSFSLMKDMSVQSRVLADRSGNQVLVGSADIQKVNGTMQGRNTSTGVKVTNQAMQVDGRILSPSLRASTRHKLGKSEFSQLWALECAESKLRCQGEHCDSG